MELSKETKDLLNKFLKLSKDTTEVVYVSKTTWVQLLTIIHKIAQALETNENKNLGNKRSISGTESAIRAERIRDEVAKTVEQGSSSDGRSPDPRKRS